MKRVLALLIFPLCMKAASFTSGSSLPGSCTTGDLFTNTSNAAGAQLYECFAANSWIQVALLGGSGGLALTSGAIDLSTATALQTRAQDVTATWAFHPQFQMVEASSGSTPAAGKDTFYVNSSDHLLHKVNSSGTDTTVGSGGGGSGTLSVATPYVTDGTFYYVPSSHMYQANFNDGTANYHSRPGDSSNTGLSWGNYGDASLTATLKTNGNWNIDNTTGNWGFYMAPYTTSTSNGRGLQLTFACTSNNGGTDDGCGGALWDQSNLKLYTMSYYGTSIVIGQWCWDPVGSSCTGSNKPRFLTSIYSGPTAGGAQTWWMQVSGASHNDITFYNSLDGAATWTTVDKLSNHSITISGLTWAGLFVTDKTTMTAYTIGGIY